MCVQFSVKDSFYVCEINHSPRSHAKSYHSHLFVVFSSLTLLRHVRAAAVVASRTCLEVVKRKVMLNPLISVHELVHTLTEGFAHAHTKVCCHLSYTHFASHLLVCVCVTMCLCSCAHVFYTPAIFLVCSMGIHLSRFVSSLEMPQPLS